MSIAVLTINLYLWTHMSQALQRDDRSDWVFAGEFATAEACHRAAANLNKSDKQHRCIDSNGGIR